MGNATDNLQLYPVGKEGRQGNLGVDGGTHIFEGTLIAQLIATGMAVPYSTASSSRCVGVSQHEADNTSGSDGDVEIQIETDRVFAFANDGSDAFDAAHILGAIVYGSDDHTVADSSNSGARQPVGFFMGMEPNGKVRVFVHPVLAGLIATDQAADVGALTLAALAGTADTTLEALPNPTDAPATADALRDDLVATLLPPLRNNLDDLGTQINALRTVLRAAGLMA